MIWFELSRVCHAPQRSGDPSPNTSHQLLPGGQAGDHRPTPSSSSAAAAEALRSDSHYLL